MTVRRYIARTEAYGLSSSDGVDGLTDERLRENLETAIEAFEAAWAFYGGVFKVALVHDLKAIVSKADHLGARIADAFLEYAQSRGFHIDTARVRAPKDKARVERSVRYGYPPRLGAPEPAARGRVCRLALFAGFCPTIKPGFRGRDARRAWGLEVQQRDRRAHDRAIDRW